MRVRIDGDRCTGHGRCYSVAPDIFDCDDSGSGFVVAPDDEVPAALQGQVGEAELSCPERAVLVTRD